MDYKEIITPRRIENHGRRDGPSRRSSYISVCLLALLLSAVLCIALGMLPPP